MDKHFTLDLADEASTLALGAALAAAMRPGLTVFLHGDLGAGKTTFVRGLLHGLGYAGKVKSPTYTLVEPYESVGDATAPFNVYHFDLYRFNDEEEWEAAGFRDFFNMQSVCLIEWPEKAAQLLPVADIEIKIEMDAPGRIARILANTSSGKACLERISMNKK